MNQNITFNPTDPFSPSCFGKIYLGFDLFEFTDPSVKFKPDTFPFGSDWHFFIALHFITAFGWPSNTNEKQKKYRKIMEPIMFSMCILTLGVSAKQMALNYTSDSNVYYNIQDTFLTLIVAFHVITTTTFHLVLMQPTIQKTELLKWKKLTDRTCNTMCTILFTMLVCFALLPIEFCPLFPITLTLVSFSLFPGGDNLMRERKVERRGWRFPKLTFLRIRKTKVMFLIAFLHSFYTVWSMDNTEPAFWPMQVCCQYQNFTFKSIVDWTLFSNCLQNQYVNKKMLPDDIAAKRRNNEIEMRQREVFPKTKCGTFCCIALFISSMFNLMFPVSLIVFKSTDLSPWDIICYNEFTGSLPFFITHLSSFEPSLNKSTVYDLLCTNKTITYR